MWRDLEPTSSAATTRTSRLGSASAARTAPCPPAASAGSPRRSRGARGSGRRYQTLPAVRSRAWRAGAAHTGPSTIAAAATGCASTSSASSPTCRESAGTSSWRSTSTPTRRPTSGCWARGWSLADPGRVARTPDAYRRYIQGSRAELMVAKGMYVEPQRLVQRAEHLPRLGSAGAGPGHRAGGALSGRRGPADVQHAGGGRRRRRRSARTTPAMAAARELAEEHFDSDKVLARWSRPPVTTAWSSAGRWASTARAAASGSG